MNKKVLILFLLFSSTMTSFGQTINDIIADYEKYREPSLHDRRFKHSDIERLVENIKNNSSFTIKKEGESIQNRAIYSIQWGNGPINVLLWSQMHGDEATATMAIFDIVNFLSAPGNELLKNSLSDKITLTFIPMLNPDGAERFTRRNALGVDLNRDALRLQSPEARILKGKRDELEADFGFNLHDQGRVYAAGNKPKQATISFLAAAYNYEKDVNEVRENSMKLISQLVKTLDTYIPGHIAKYSDEFEPRAFGDNIQKWGTSLVLIESGGYPGDRDKQVIRKMNFVALLTSFNSIALGQYKTESIKQYEDLPFNERLFFDLLIKGVTIEKEGKEYLVDIAVNQLEVSTSNAREYYLRGVIEEVGDLSIYYGYETLDASGMKAFPGEKSQVVDLSKVDSNVREGVLFYEQINSKKIEGKPMINIVGKNGAPAMKFKIGNLANFVIKKEGEIKYIVLNGFLIDVSDQKSEYYGLDLR